MSRRRKVRLPAAESRQAEVLTVGWMLAALTALACQAAWLLTLLLEWLAPGAGRVALLGRLLLFAAAVSGLVSIGLSGAVLRWRKAPVPPAILYFAWATAVLPLLILTYLAI